jgi:hypothetical protein
MVLTEAVEKYGADSAVARYERLRQDMASGRYDFSETSLNEAARSIAAQAARLGPDARPVASAAGGLVQSEDLPSARDALGRLGDAIVTLANASRAGLGDGVNIAYCPMVRHHWLQTGTAIRNPFYGQRMLECGRLTTAPPTSKH